ncbi:hypothetical protein C3438_22315 (plasmid) [Bacillus velezensis]|uniref:hypothetical protein n=1 Tax=Bacillaceae TaxID=186817 RepID=UPI000CDFFB2A|nr:hypothetical protein C3438_22315 [Bacillus velezensis]QHM08263.1 hypothetical protein C7M27_04288 [Bacillus subtilis]
MGLLERPHRNKTTRGNEWTQSVKKNKDKRGTIKVPRDQHDRLMALAFAKDLKMPGLLLEVEQLLQETLTEDEKAMYQTMLKKLSNK